MCGGGRVTKFEERISGGSTRLNEGGNLPNYSCSILAPKFPVSVSKCFALHPTLQGYHLPVSSYYIRTAQSYPFQVPYQLDEEDLSDGALPRTASDGTSMSCRTEE